MVCWPCFPLAYATVLPALYAPIIAMLLGLVFRGVAFEFRWRTIRGRWVWDWAFFLGSVVSALAQGIALGALVQGIAIDNRRYVGGWWDWLQPFSITTGIALVVGYTLLGATWLNMKTTDPVRHRARGIAWWSMLATLALIGVVSLWTPFVDPIYYERWFTFPTEIFSVIVPAAILVCVWFMRQGLVRGHDSWPFLAALALFILCFAGIGISFYPYIVPGALTIEEAAAPDASLWFLLVGAAVLVPMILAYTAYAYWVFRGKVDPESGYH